MGGQVDAEYARPDGRKQVTANWNPADLLRNPNKFTLIAGAAVIVLLLLIVLLVRFTLRRARRRRAK